MVSDPAPIIKNFVENYQMPIYAFPLFTDLISFSWGCSDIEELFPALSHVLRGSVESKLLVDAGANVGKMSMKLLAHFPGNDLVAIEAID
jgi:hypothetical protein